MKSREDILHDKVEKIYKNRAAADFEEEKRKLNWEANFSYRILADQLSPNFTHVRGC